MSRIKEPELENELRRISAEHNPEGILDLVYLLVDDPDMKEVYDNLRRVNEEHGEVAFGRWVSAIMAPKSALTEHEMGRDALMHEIVNRFPECGYDAEEDKEEANDILDLLDIYAPCLLLHPLATGEFLRHMLGEGPPLDIGFISGLVRLQRDFEDSRKLGFEVEAAKLTMAALKRELADE